MRTKQNILFHTFIGLVAEVINSSSSVLIGKKGKIIDETKNLLVIEVLQNPSKISWGLEHLRGQKSMSEGVKHLSAGTTGSLPPYVKEVKIPKNGSVFRLYLDDGTIFDISGKDICFRPEERAKKLM